MRLFEILMKTSLKSSKIVKKTQFGVSLSIGSIGRTCTFLDPLLHTTPSYLVGKHVQLQNAFWGCTRKVPFFTFFDVFRDFSCFFGFRFHYLMIYFTGFIGCVLLDAIENYFINIINLF